MVDAPTPVGTPGKPAPVQAEEILVRGVVQGVGFRPFVHRLARRHGVHGWVRNEAGAVRIHAEAPLGALGAFVAELGRDAPVLARIDDVRRLPGAAAGARGFVIEASDAAPTGRLPVSPDVGVCAACAAEFRDPADRRFGYPFITCTDCGPRYTVVESMPYDRERSSMRAFPPCPACAREYRDPRGRRYHCETISCPRCGPRVWFRSMHDGLMVDGAGAVDAAARALRSGLILAVRGLGGFHLAVDATHEVAVRRLRCLKAREAKPLAVMVRDLAEAGELGVVRGPERAALQAGSAPIVLLERHRASGRLAPSVAPGLDRIGVMLAYTPLHLRLLAAAGRPLVMTSGNRAEEPIAAANDEALERLAGTADAFLLHDREIVARCDDSVVRLAAAGPVLLRRARGWAPLPLPLPVPAHPPVVAFGSHLKNTFTLAADGQAFVSPHLGDLNGLETLRHARDTLAHYRALFRIEPQIAARDLHPGYLSSREAEASGLPTVSVQHHHAHVAAVLAEHGRPGPVLGIAFDGTGLGDDGHVWGAEFLVATLTGYRRRGRLRYAPLPGGDRAARSPWRVALGYRSLSEDGDAPGPAEDAGLDPRALRTVEHQIERGVNSPLASSMGRLFDAAASVLGVRQESRYEGHAAMEMEAAAASHPGMTLPLPWAPDPDGVRVMDPLPLLAFLAAARRRGRPVPLLAADFHDSVVRSTVELAAELCEEAGVRAVALGGGCFQNVRLLDGVVAGLEGRGLEVLLPRRLGPNDGAISYGQAAVAAALAIDPDPGI